MYQYDFKDNVENIIFENANSLVDIDDKTYPLSVVITNKNILLFHNANQNNILNTRGMYMPPEFLLELKIPRQSLDYQVLNGDTIIKFKQSEITLFNIDLDKIN